MASYSEVELLALDRSMADAEIQYNSYEEGFERGQKDGKRLMKAAILAMLDEMFEAAESLSADEFAWGIKAAKERVEKFA